MLIIQQVLSLKAVMIFRKQEKHLQLLDKWRFIIRRLITRTFEQSICSLETSYQQNKTVK